MGWLYRDADGVERGPFDTEQMAGMIREGVVSRGSLLRREGAGENVWYHPAELAEFRGVISSQNEAGAEVGESRRVASSLLPDVIRVIAILSLLAGIASTVAALATDSLWLLPTALSSLLSAPFLYGFADIVLSLRRLCAKS